jgi:histidinol-phosphate aminotransferase
VAERGLTRYPDPLGTAFRMRAADVLGVPRDWILCGNGSDDILTIVTRAMVGPGDVLRLPYPSISCTAPWRNSGPRSGKCIADNWS